MLATRASSELFPFTDHETETRAGRGKFKSTRFCVLTREEQRPPGEVCWHRTVNRYAESHRVTLGLAVALSIRHDRLCIATCAQSQNRLGGCCRQESVRELRSRTSSENAMSVASAIRALPFCARSHPGRPFSRQLDEAGCEVPHRRATQLFIFPTPSRQVHAFPDFTSFERG